MNINRSIFNAYDMRGVYPIDLDEEIADRIGRAFTVFLDAPRVVVGRDMRLSGLSLMAAVNRGLVEQGDDVLDIGLWSAPISTTMPALHLAFRG